MGCSKSSSKREVYSNTILPQETRNISNKQPTLTPKAIRERRTKNPKVSRRKKIIKIRSEINEKEMKEMIAKINKTKTWFFEKINKVDKPLARLIKEKRKKTQINRIRNEKEELALQKYKGSCVITTSNYMPIKWTTWKKWTNS